MAVDCRAVAPGLSLAASRNEGQAMDDVHDAIDFLREAAAALFEEVRAATADVHGVTRDAFGAKPHKRGARLLLALDQRRAVIGGFFGC
jgi:hypothetical protein